MTGKTLYTAVFASVLALSGFGAAHAGTIVFEAEEEQEIVIVEEEPAGSGNAAAASQSRLKTNDDEAEKPARLSKAKRAPR